MDLNLNPPQQGILGKLVNTMPAEALAPCVTRSSAVKVLTTYNRQVVLAFYKEGFELLALLQRQGITSNPNTNVS